MEKIYELLSNAIFGAVVNVVALFFCLFMWAEEFKKWFFGLTFPTLAAVGFIPTITAIWMAIYIYMEGFKNTPYSYIIIGVISVIVITFVVIALIKKSPKEYMREYEMR